MANAFSHAYGSRSKIDALDIYQHMKDYIDRRPLSRETTIMDWDHVTKMMQGDNAANYTTPESLKQAIIHRLRGMPNLDYWHPIYVEKTGLVVMFVMKDGNPTILEDDFNLFPSDAFITKLRLMLT